MSQVTFDGHAPIDVSPVILQSYLLEQCSLQGWRIVCTGYDRDGKQVIECQGKDGAEHVIEVQG